MDVRFDLENTTMLLGGAIHMPRHLPLIQSKPGTSDNKSGKTCFESMSCASFLVALFVLFAWTSSL